MTNFNNISDSINWTSRLLGQAVYLGDVSVGHEGVEDPEGDVGEQQEGDDLGKTINLS